MSARKPVSAAPSRTSAPKSAHSRTSPAAAQAPSRTTPKKVESNSVALNKEKLDELNGQVCL